MAHRRRRHNARTSQQRVDSSVDDDRASYLHPERYGLYFRGGKLVQDRRYAKPSDAAYGGRLEDVEHLEHLSLWDTEGSRVGSPQGRSRARPSTTRAGGMAWGAAPVRPSTGTAPPRGGQCVGAPQRRSFRTGRADQDSQANRLLERGGIAALERAEKAEGGARVAAAMQAAGAVLAQAPGQVDYASAVLREACARVGLSGAVGCPPGVV